MACSRKIVFALLATTAGCGSGPSKSEALHAITQGASPDALCTLPIEVLSSTKMQYATKAVCVPKDLAATERIKGCMEALAAANLTRPMPASYMREWPDDVAARSLSDLPAYERRARELVYVGCWSIDDHLREGQFVCAKATPESVASVTKIDEAHADVKYTQALAPIEALSAIDRACAGVTRPPSDVTVRLEKISTGWAVAAVTSPVVAR